MTRPSAKLRALVAAATLAALAACSGPLLTHDAAGAAPADSSQQAQAVHGMASTGTFQ